jgi:hypothetical protein
MMAADTVADAGEGRRPSIEKKPIVVIDAADGLVDKEPPAFERLPDEIIQQYAPSLHLLSSLLSGMHASCPFVYSPNMTEYSRLPTPMASHRWRCSTRNGEASPSKRTSMRTTSRVARRMP